MGPEMFPESRLLPHRSHLCHFAAPSTGLLSHSLGRCCGPHTGSFPGTGMPVSCSYVTPGLVLSPGVSGGDAPGTVGYIPAHGC